MKIRAGFVSNSSSSSFIIRGIKISRSDALDLIRPEGLNNDFNDYYILGQIEKLAKGLSCRPDICCFDCDTKKATKFIVGMALGRLEDGVFVELPEPNDTAIGALIQRLGLSINKRFKTYVQMVSNDNF